MRWMQQFFPGDVWRRFAANTNAFIGGIDLTSIRADKDFVKPDKALVQMIDPATAQQMVESYLN